MREARLAAAVATLALLPASGRGEGVPPPVATIVDRAVERAVLNEEQRPEAAFRYHLLSTLEELDAEGEITERREALYQLVKLEGRPYLRLVENDGRPPGEQDLERERERERRFRERLREEAVRDAEEDEKDQDTIRFDRDLVSRYEARFLEIRPFSDRHAYVLEYWPREGELPERRRVDRILNASRGIIWIDTETYEVARLEFELTRTVRFWWFLGSVSRLDGYYERLPVDGVWLPSRGALGLRGRSLFSAIRRNQAAEWRDFARWEGADDVEGRLPRPEDGAPLR